MFWESFITRKLPHFPYYVMWASCRIALSVTRPVNSAIYVIYYMLMEVNTHRIYLCCLLLKLVMYYKPLLSFLEGEERQQQQRQEWVLMNKYPTTNRERNISLMLAAAILSTSTVSYFQHPHVFALYYMIHFSVFVLSPGAVNRIPAFSRYLFFGTSTGSVLLFLHLVMTMQVAFLQICFYGWMKRPHEGHNVFVALCILYSTYEQIS
eukprot:PhF_6_TR5955/c0_g1_i1/m.8604